MHQGERSLFQGIVDKAPQERREETRAVWKLQFHPNLRFWVLAVSIPLTAKLATSDFSNVRADRKDTLA
jgi:hypothetical protein